MSDDALDDQTLHALARVSIPANLSGAARYRERPDAETRQSLRQPIGKGSGAVAPP